MIERRLCLLAAAAALSLGIAGDARAGCCPTCGCGPVIVAQPTQIYVVNQGPVFSGPGHHIRQASEPITYTLLERQKNSTIWNTTRLCWVVSRSLRVPLAP